MESDTPRKEGWTGGHNPLGARHFPHHRGLSATSIARADVFVRGGSTASTPGPAPRDGGLGPFALLGQGGEEEDDMHPLARHSRWKTQFETVFEGEGEGEGVRGTPAGALRLAIAQGHPSPLPAHIAAYTASSPDKEWPSRALWACLGPALSSKSVQKRSIDTPWGNGPEDKADPLAGLPPAHASICRALVLCGSDGSMQDEALRMLSRGGRPDLARLALLTLVSAGRRRGGAEGSVEDLKEEGSGWTGARHATLGSGFWRPPLVVDREGECRGAGGEAGRMPVHVVCTLGGLHAMRASLELLLVRTPGPVILGLDAEWRPTGRGGRQQLHPAPPFAPSTNGKQGKPPSVWPASTLQLAVEGRAWVVDLLALHAVGVGFTPRGGADVAPGGAGGVHPLCALAETLTSTLGWALTERRLAKVGFGVRGDLDRIAASYAPYATLEGRGGDGFFAAIAHSVTDLRDLLPACSGGTLPLPSSLSHALETCVPGAAGGLDKTCQTSDWQARPLALPQLEYAARDAMAAVAVCTALAAGMSGHAWELALAASEAGGGSSWRADEGSFLPWRARPLATRQEEGGDAMLRVRTWTHEPCWLDSGTGGREEVLPACVAPVAAALERAGLSPRGRILAATEGDFIAPGTTAVKSLALLHGNEPILALLPLTERLDLARLSALLAPPSGRRVRLRFASAEECFSVFGYVPGTVPPVGLACEATGYRTVVHAGLAEAGLLEAGGGGREHRLRLPWAELHAVLSNACPVLIATLTAGRARDASQEAPPLSTPLAPLPLPCPTFLCDGMLGRLTRWLRVIGVDTESTVGPGADRWAALYEGDGASLSGSRSVPLSAASTRAWAAASHRIILTRDRKLLTRRAGEEGKEEAAVFWVPSNDTHSAFEAVSAHFSILVAPADVMSRCARCNGRGYERVSPAVALASGAVPAKVCHALSDFWRCWRCGKIYWEGSKFEDTRGKLRALFEGGEAELGVGT